MKKIFIILICLHLIIDINAQATSLQNLENEIESLKKEMEFKEKELFNYKKEAALELKEAIKAVKDEVSNKNDEAVKVWIPIIAGVLGLLLGGLGGFLGVKSYVNSQINTLTDKQIKERELEWNAVLNLQKVDKVIKEKKKILTLSFEHKNEEELRDYFVKNDFEKKNLSYKLIELDDDRKILNEDELILEASKKDLVVFNVHSRIFGEPKDTELIIDTIIRQIVTKVQETSSKPYFFGYSRGLKLPGGIEKLNFCTNKYTFFSNLMDSLRYQELFEKHSRS